MPLHVPVPYFVFLDDIGELSDPDEAVVRGDEQEAVAAVQRGSSGLHQADLDMPSTWFHTNTHRQVDYQWPLCSLPPGLSHKSHQT